MAISPPGVAVVVRTCPGEENTPVTIGVPGVAETVIGKALLDDAPFWI
jgi:hypothetical protein